MRVLVLGGSGLIGRTVVTELVNHRYEILALNRLSRQQTACAK